MFDFHFENIVLIPMGVVNMLLGILIFWKGYKEQASRAFVWLSFTIALWAWSLSIARSLGDHTIFALPAARFLYTIAAFLPYWFFMFAVSFLAQTQKKISYAIVPVIGIALLALFSDSIIEGVAIQQGRTIWLFGRWYPLFVFYLSLYFFSGLFIVLRRYRNADPASVQKIQLRFAFIGTMFPIILGLITNVIFLSILGNYNYQWLGPAGTSIMAILFTYAILKHHLFDLKVISTEVFSAVLVLVLLFQIFFGDTFQMQLLNTIIFFGAAGFGILLVRSVIKDVENREELERLTQELSAANEELKKLDRAKSEFISIASHQLRTPLSIIKGYISMIEEGSFGRITKKIAEPLRRVYLSNERLIKLVNDLLDLSRMEGGRMRYDMKPAQFSVIVASVVEEFQQIAQSKGVTVRFKKEGENFSARLDEEKMRQVAFNLIDNAVRYTPKGGSITVTLAVNLYHLLFSVADTGIGLEKQESNGLFQKFVRNKEVARIHTEGVGLGLYVARRIVEDHGGRIWAESAGKGKGSTFFVELPIKKIAV